jgi:hypothetical protein
VTPTSPPSMDSCNRFLSRLEAPNARCRVTGSLAEAGVARSGAVDGFELDRRSSSAGDARSWLVRTAPHEPAVEPDGPDRGADQDQ